MSDKAIKLSDDPYIEFEEFIVVTPDDIPAVRDQVWGYLPAPDVVPDLAVSKPTAASSFVAGITPRPPAAAVDPIRTNAWFSTPDDAWPRWWQVDLQDTYRILEIKLYLAGTYGEPGNNLKSFEIQHSATGAGAWTTVYSITDNGTTVEEATLDIVLTPPVSDRYWRVLIHEDNDDSYSRIAHFEAYGYKLHPIAVREGDLSGDTNGTTVSGLVGFPLTGAPSATGDTVVFHTDDGQFHIEAGGIGSGGTGGGGALHAVRAYHTGQVQTIPNGSTAAIQFNSTRVDTDGYFDTGQPTRLTIPAGLGGKYIASIGVRIDAVADSAIGVTLRRNNTISEMSHSLPPSSISTPGAARFLSATSPVLDLVPGDYLEITLGNSSGGSAAIDSSSGGTGNYSPEFSLYMLGDVGIVGSSLPEVGAEVLMIGDTSVASATWVPIPFATATYDTNSFYDAGNPTRLTVPAGMAGLYHVSANTRMIGDPGTIAVLRLLVNGTDEEARDTLDRDQSDPYALVNAVIKLDAGDYVEAVVYQNSGSTRSLNDMYTGSGEKSGGVFRITKIGTISEPIVPAAARIHISTSQSIANGGAIVSFDTTDYDTNGFYSSSSPTRLTIPAGQAGLYSITANIHWADASDQYYRMGPHLLLNGAEFVAFETGIVSPNPSPSNSVTTDYMLNEGDYIQVKAYYTSDSSKSITTAALMLHKITGSGASIAGLSDVTGDDPIVVTGTGDTRNVAFTPAAAVSFQGQQITNVRLENLASAPTGSVGRVYTDTALNKLRAYVNAMWQNIVTDQTALGGAITGTIGATVLPTKGTPGTYAYPVSVTTDSNGDITSITAGSAPVTGVTGSAPIASSGGTTPAISWNPTAAFSNNGQAVQNFVIESLATAPTGATGRVYTDTALNKMRAYINAAWQSFITEATTLGGVLTGNLPNPGLASVVTAATITNPASIQYNAAGQVIAAASGNAQVDLQGSSPGTAQTGSARVSASLGAGTRYYLNTVPILESGTTFPSTGLVDAQRYWHGTYRSWFIYNLAATEWYQENPGVFDGSFPTVSGGDNTIAPKIRIRRLDIGDAVFYWDGTIWNSVIGNIVMLPVPARVIDDSTTRANGYTTNVQVTGVNTLVGGTPLPSTIKGVFVKVTLLGPATAGSLIVVVENPDATGGGTSVSGYSSGLNSSVTGLAITGLSTLGQLKVTIQGVGVSRYVIDVVAYQLFDSATAFQIPAGTINATTALQVNGSNVNPVPKNWIINGNMDVCQRFGPLGSAVVAASSGFIKVVDRFGHFRDGTGATVTVSQQAFTPGQTNVPGEPTYFLRVAQSVAGSGSTSSLLDHSIEDVRTFAGQACTVSFWAKADAARSVSHSMVQIFGTGGSASVATAGTTLNLTTSWQKFTVTYNTIPSVASKTISTTNDSRLISRLSLPLNVVNTIEIAQYQVEAGLNAGPFQKKSFAEELQACKRYYQKSFDYGQVPGPGIDNGRLYPPFLNFSGSTYYTWPLEVEMRIAPTVNYYRPNAGTSANLAWNYNRSNHATAMTTSVLTARRIEVAIGVNTGWALGDLIAFQYDASAEF
jgi:hypothetical protein